MSAVGYVGIALIILGAVVWIFRPSQAGNIEFEFLGFKARANSLAIGVMALGIIMTLVGGKQLAPPSEHCQNIEGDYKSTKNQTFHITQTGCRFSTVVHEDAINVDNHVEGELSKNLASYHVKRVDHNKNDCTIQLGGFLTNVTDKSYDSHVFNLSSDDDSRKCGFPSVKDNLPSNTDQFRWTEQQSAYRIK